MAWTLALRPRTLPFAVPAKRTAWRLPRAGATCRFRLNSIRALISAASTDLGRMIESWGVVPMQYLQELSKKKYTYAYVGTEDLTMYPLLSAGLLCAGG